MSVEVNQILCKYCYRRLGSGLYGLPFSSRKLVDPRRCAVAAYIFLDYIHLFHRDIEHIASGIFYLYIILLLSLDFELFDAYELAYSMIFMNYIISAGKIGKRLDPLSLFFESPAVLCLLAVFKYIVFAYPAAFFLREIYSGSQRSPGEGDLFFQPHS